MIAFIILHAPCVCCWYVVSLEGTKHTPPQPSTTKTPAGAIKTTRTILLYWYYFDLFCTHIHPVIRVFRSSCFFPWPPLVQRLGSSAQPCCCDASRIGWTSLGAETRKANSERKRSEWVCTHIHTQTREGILAVFLYIRYMIMICTCVSYVFLYTYDDWCVCLWQ